MLTLRRSTVRPGGAWLSWRITTFFPPGRPARRWSPPQWRLANPGWCGTFGNYPNDALQVAFGSTNEGNYDLTQMHLIPMAYAYYDLLSCAGARASHQLAVGRRAGPRPRPGRQLGPAARIRTPGAGPESRCSARSNKSIGETENHILLIMTARYLANQLLYQRSHEVQYDNRRNSRRRHGCSPRRVPCAVAVGPVPAPTCSWRSCRDSSEMTSPSTTRRTISARPATRCSTSRPTRMTMRSASRREWSWTTWRPTSPSPATIFAASCRSGGATRPQRAGTPTMTEAT